MATIATTSHQKEINVKQRRIQRQRTGRASLSLKFLKGLFLKILTAEHAYKLYCYQHAMFTTCISLSTLTTKTKGINNGSSKQSLDLKNYTTPPILKFLDPPL